MTEHETVHDCDLPDETYNRPDDGEIVECSGCGREWRYCDGYFTPLEDENEPCPNCGCQERDTTSGERGYGTLVFCDGCGRRLADIDPRDSRYTEDEVEQ